MTKGVDNKLIQIRRQVLETALEMKKQHVQLIISQYEEDRQKYKVTPKHVAAMRLRRLGCTTEEVELILATLESKHDESSNDSDINL
jgi:hypothetical protein